MTDLNPIHSWLSHATLCGDLTPGAAVRTLSQELSTTYDVARIGQWRRGERSIPEPEHGWILRYVLVDAIEAEGGKRRAPVRI